MIHKHMCQSDIFLIEVILTLSEYLYDTQIYVSKWYIFTRSDIDIIRVDAGMHWSYEHL
jgi:hypothetical protein